VAHSQLPQRVAKEPQDQEFAARVRPAERWMEQGIGRDPPRSSQPRPAEREKQRQAADRRRSCMQCNRSAGFRQPIGEIKAPRGPFRPGTQQPPPWMQPLATLLQLRQPHGSCEAAPHRRARQAGKPRAQSFPAAASTSEPGLLSCQGLLQQNVRMLRDRAPSGPLQSDVVAPGAAAHRGASSQAKVELSWRRARPWPHQRRPPVFPISGPATRRSRAT